MRFDNALVFFRVTGMMYFGLVFFYPNPFFTPVFLQISSKDEDFLDLSVDVEQNTSITHCLR